MFVFPFWLINEKESIIIYGAGGAGQDYLQQVIQLDYCHIVCIADKDYARCPDLGVPIIPPEGIPTQKFDKILIAIDDEQTRAIVSSLLREKYVVPRERIIDIPLQRLGKLTFKEKWPMPGEERKKYDNGKLYLAFCLNGGLGDWIIAKRWILAILNEIEHADYGIDLYTSKHSAENYCPALMGDLPINGFRSLFDDGVDLGRYDVVFHMTYVIDFLQEPHWDDLERKDSRFCSAVRKIKQKSVAYNIPLAGSSLSTHFRRCRFMGFNCYSFIKYYGLDMDDWHVHIPLIPGFDDMERLPSRYITLNYGWGNFAVGEHSSKNAKIWPLPYFEELVSLLHKRFSNITLVQLGVRGTPRMKGIDSFLCSEPLERIKHILRKAVLHIDCEGGLVHLATQLGTKCAVLFGSTPQHYFGYEENLNITSGRCSDCYYLFDDFSKCAKGLEEPECMYSLSPVDVADAVREYIESKADL